MTRTFALGLVAAGGRPDPRQPENGDTLVSVNGMELTSADKALEVYTQLRDATQLTLKLQRRATTVTLVITINLGQRVVPRRERVPF